jgi:hypothetical protein
MIRARATALLFAVIAAFAVAAATHSHDARAQAAALRASGAVQVANSHNGSAILSGALGPGDSLSGTVAISNIGKAGGAFTLGLSHLTDTPGPGGGFLSRRLDLQVDDVTNPLAPKSIYHGRLNSLNPTVLGTFATGAVHIYRFVVSWADGPADPTMAGSKMSVQFDWSAGDNSPTPPTPTPPVSVAPSPPAAVAPPKLSLTMAKRQPVVNGGGVKAKVQCEAACTIVGTGYVSAPGAAKTYRLAPARKGAGAGKKVSLKLRLPGRARGPLRAALSAHRRLVVQITITATGSSGQVTRVKRKIRVSG